MVFPADEFYLLAEREIPSTEFYEDYPQYENGVGLLRSLEDEFDQALEEYNDCEERTVTIATGAAVYEFQKMLAQKAMDKFPKLKVNVVKIINYFFGETITVTGLITAGDLIEQLKGRDLGDELIIAKVMLKTDEPVFLDDLSVQDVEKALNIHIRPSDNNGYELLECMLGIQQ